MTYLEIEKLKRYSTVQMQAANFMMTLEETCPPSQGKSLAISHLQECALLAIASIMLEKENV